MIIEYKLHMSFGGMTTPDWVLDPGYFYNPENYSLVGITTDDGVRQFYLPDTVVVLNRQLLRDRQIAINALYPANPPMTNEEIIAEVDAWCDAKGEP